MPVPSSPSAHSYSGWKPQPLPEPWVVAPADIRPSLETELRAEVADGHPLSGETVTAIARCQTCDDVVFSVEGDHPIWFALVHLTWRRSRELPPWPITEQLELPLAQSLRAHTH